MLSEKYVLSRGKPSLQCRKIIDMLCGCNKGQSPDTLPAAEKWSKLFLAIEVATS